MSDSINGKINGNEDVSMDDANPIPGATPGISAEFSVASLEAGSTSATRSHPDDSDDHEPPAKRARMLTDAEMASTAHVSLFSYPFSLRHYVNQAC
jgi:bromodomain-containing factor 1